MATTTRPPARPARGSSRRRPAPARHGGSLLRALAGFLVVAAVITGGVIAALHRLSPGTSVVVVERCTATTTSASGSVDHDLAPDQAGNAALISAVVARRGLPARAATIATATAMQESKLRNITYGDRDSLGLFQQRPSQGWGTAAQVQDPVYATNAFLSSMVQISDYATLPVGDVAQRVQRSAYPSAYEQHEDDARAWASALAGFSPGGLTCRLRGVASADSTAQAAAPSGYWPRTQAVLDRVAVERGPLASAVADGGAGVRLGTPTTATDAAGVRAGWAMAAWSVAHADDLDVVAVGTDGKVWRRDTPDAGWTALSGDAAATWAPPGAAVVVVAGGATP